MTQAVRIEGMKEILQTLSVLGEAMLPAQGRALERFAEIAILTPAKEEYVPVMFGALRASIRLIPAEITRGKIVVGVGAGGSAVPYALAVHENPRSGRTGGVSPSGKKYTNYSRVGQWKYLETPLMESAGKLDELAAECRKELEDVVHGIR